MVHIVHGLSVLLKITKNLRLSKTEKIMTVMIGMMWLKRTVRFTQ